MHSKILRAPLPLGLTDVEGQLLEAYQHKVAAWGWKWQGQASGGRGTADLLGPLLTHVPLLWGSTLTATDLKVGSGKASTMTSLFGYFIHGGIVCSYEGLGARLPPHPAALPTPSTRHLRLRWPTSGRDPCAQFQGVPWCNHVWRQAEPGGGERAADLCNFEADRVVSIWLAWFLMFDSSHDC